MNPILWQADEAQRSRSQMVGFMRWVEKRHDCSLPDYQALHRWSIDQRENFWNACMDYTGIETQRAATRIVHTHDNMRRDKWFVDCRLNFAENLLRYRDERPALIFRDERGNRDALSHARLYQEVKRVAQWLQVQGVEPGDRVAGFVANRVETVVAMLAASSLGAIWTSCSPDFGVNAVLDRFRQIEPKILFAVSSHCYAGRIIDHRKTLQSLLQQLPSIDQLIVFPDLYQQEHIAPGGSVPCRSWDSLSGDPEQPLQFHSAAFNDPLFIMYSSGTTGVPKCIVHGHGGTLLQHRKEHMLHLDLRRDDVLFYFTSCGWMMWNWLVSGLAAGATVVLYDGSPFHPQPSCLFDLIDECGITVFGVSARFIAAAEKADLEPVRTHSLAQLRTILSTGSPLSAEGFDYVYEKVHPHVALQSISGGTDIISCFVLGCPILPVRRGEIQCAGLGMDVAVFNEQGQAVTGEKGELVCRRSFPSMPIGFWRDEGDRRYHKAYFSRFPGVWTHGDYAEETAAGGYIIHGRSDTVLNPGGVRIGTAEIYRQVERLPEVLESIAVGLDRDGDVGVILFVRLEENRTLDETLTQRIRQAIRAGASPRHVPEMILQVGDIPRTLSGKIAEVAVRDTINGKAVTNEDALANPQSLAEYSALKRHL